MLAFLINFGIIFDPIGNFWTSSYGERSLQNSYAIYYLFWYSSELWIRFFSQRDLWTFVLSHYLYLSWLNFLEEIKGFWDDHPCYFGHNWQRNLSFHCLSLGDLWHFVAGSTKFSTKIFFSFFDWALVWDDKTTAFVNWGIFFGDTRVKHIFSTTSFWIFLLSVEFRYLIRWFYIPIKKSLINEILKERHLLIHKIT